MTFTIKAEDVKKTEKLIKYNKKISYRKLTCDNNVSKVSIIGVGMITTPGITYRMFQALAAKKINIPTLAVLAKFDQMTPLKSGKKFVDLLDNCELKVLDCGHFLQAERPKELNLFISSYLRKLN